MLKLKIKFAQRKHLIPSYISQMITLDKYHILQNELDIN